MRLLLPEKRRRPDEERKEIFKHLSTIQFKPAGSPRCASTPEGLISVAQDAEGVLPNIMPFPWSYMAPTLSRDIRYYLRLVPSATARARDWKRAAVLQE